MGASSDFFRMDSGVSAQPAATPLPLILAAVVLCTLPMIVLSQLAAHWRFDVVDDQMFGYFGWRIANGATVYVDVWDNKPPGIYWINALGFLIGGGTYYGVIALCAAALIAWHVLFFGIASSVYFRGAAAVLTVLASFFMTHIFYQGGTNRTETFLVLFELAAVACYVRGFARNRSWKWLLAGALCGCAFLCKQVGLAAFGAMGLHLLILMLTREVPLGTGIRRGVLLILGLAVTLSAAAAYLASQGALQAAWFAAFTFNRAYFEAGDSSFTSNWFNRHMLQNHMFPILRLPILLAAASALHAFVWWLKPQLRPQEIVEPIRQYGPVCPRYTLFFGIWMLLAFYGACVSPHYFRHYLIPFVPPLMLFGGHIISVITTEIGLTRRLAQRGWVAAAYVAMGWFALDAFKFQWEEAARVLLDRFPGLNFTRAAPGEPLGPAIGTFSGYKYRKTTWEQVGDEVFRLTKPDQSIHCWGYLPGVYLYTHRINACRFITTEKIGHVGDRADFVRQELHRVFQQAPPALFVVSAQDYNWFMGNGSRARDWLGEWLAGWLDKTYARVVDMNVPDAVIYIYKRRDLLDGTETILPVPESRPAPAREPGQT